jgi:hypothetical protein
MSVRVLSTDQGKAAIEKMQSILSGGLAEQITALKAQGEILSDPNIWDGALADDFRTNTWPASATSLDQVADSIEELRSRTHAINGDIMTAGGNS